MNPCVETAAYVQENARIMRYRGGATVVALVMEARSFVPQACHMESHGDIAFRCGHFRLTFFIAQWPTKMVSMDQLQ